MSQQGRAEIIIGIFVVTAVVALAGMILAFGGSISLFTQTYTVEIEFNHVGDLLPGAPVKYGGVRIGRVSEISLQPDGKIRATAAIIDDENIRLYEGYGARIQTSGLVGDTFVEFYAPRGSSQAVPLQESDKPVDGTGQVTTTELLEQVKDIGLKVTAIADNVNDIIGDEEFKKNIRATVKSTAGASRAAERFLTDLQHASDNVNSASDDIRETATTIRTMTVDVHDAVGRTITSEENIEAVRETLSNVRTASRDATEMSGHLTSILARSDNLFEEEEPRIRAAVEDVAVITRDLRTKLAAIETDKGVMRFFTTNDINRKFESLFETLEGPVEHVSGIVGNLSMLDLFQAYFQGRSLAEQRQQELRRLGYTTTAEMRDAEFRQTLRDVERRETMGPAEAE